MARTRVVTVEKIEKVLELYFAGVPVRMAIKIVREKKTALESSQVKCSK
jgi:cell division protein FtsL